MTEIYNGVAEDPRSELEKAKDFSHEELFMGPVPIEWKEKTEAERKHFIIRDQDGSSACVAFGTAKLLGIHELKEGRTYANLSPKFIYVKRTNYNSGGMWLPNALGIACNYGAPLETSLPCENKGETFMNDTSSITPEIEKEAQEYRAKSYFAFNKVNGKYDLDEIAAILEQGYGILIAADFDYNEWTDVPFIDPNSKKQCGHGFAGIDYLLHNGEKSILIEDSWGPYQGKGGQRILTETFINERVKYIGYVTELIKEQGQDGDKPKHTFKKILRFGNNNIDVLALQQCLKYLGLFPLNVKMNGNYGPVTRKAVSDFQKQYVGASNSGWQVGPLTLAKLNELFS